MLTTSAGGQIFGIQEKIEEHAVGDIAGVRCIEKSGLTTIGCATEVRYLVYLRKEDIGNPDLWIETNLEFKGRMRTWSGDWHEINSAERGMWKVATVAPLPFAYSLNTDKIHLQASYKAFCALEMSAKISMKLRAFKSPKEGQKTAILSNVFNFSKDGLEQEEVEIRWVGGRVRVPTRKKVEPSVIHGSQFALDEALVNALLDDPTNTTDRRTRRNYSGEMEIPRLSPVHCKLTWIYGIGGPLFYIPENFQWDLILGRKAGGSRKSLQVGQDPDFESGVARPRAGPLRAETESQPGQWTEEAPWSPTGREDGDLAL